jgi:predicted DNA-binding transcriptional regulator AlpA
LHIRISRPTIYKMIELGIFPIHDTVFKGRKYWNRKTLNAWAAKRYSK